MNILFVATVYRHLVNFHIPYMQYFQKQGYTVYAISNGGEDRQILMDLGIQCIDIPFSRNPFSTKNIEAYRELSALFKRQQFDLIHVNSPISALLTRFVYRKFKAGPIVYTAHGFHFFDGAPKLNWAIYYPLEKIAARWTDHLFTMNEEDYRNAQKFMPADKLSLVHGVGVAFTKQPVPLSELRKSLKLSDEAIVISFVAELIGNKNHQYLLRNWPKIKEQCPEAVLLILGAGELENELKDYVAKQQLRDIRFLGHRQDVEQILQLTHICTLLSYREGLPKSIMEAMYMGIPCIVTDTRGLRDLIVDGENGYILSQEADAELVEAFVTLIKSKLLRVEMGIYSQEMIEPYLLENVLPEYSVIYKKLLK